MRLLALIIQRQPDSLLEVIVQGSLVVLAGLLIVIFHRAIKEYRDHLGALGWPIGFGGWTGNYTRGGLILTYATIIVAGLLLMFVGASMIISAVVR